MKYISISLLTLLIFIMSSCKIIENKSQETINKENEKLSKFIQKQESELKIEMGEPDKVFYDDNGSKFFIYTKKNIALFVKENLKLIKAKLF